MSWDQIGSRIALAIAVSLMAWGTYDASGWFPAMTLVIVFLITYYIGYRHGQFVAIDGILGKIEMTYLFQDSEPPKED